MHVTRAQIYEHYVLLIVKYMYLPLERPSHLQAFLYINGSFVGIIQVHYSVTASKMVRLFCRCKRLSLNLLIRRQQSAVFKQYVTTASKSCLLRISVHKLFYHMHHIAVDICMVME